MFIVWAPRCPLPSGCLNRDASVHPACIASSCMSLACLPLPHPFRLQRPAEASHQVMYFAPPSLLPRFSARELARSCLHNPPSPSRRASEDKGTVREGELAPCQSPLLRISISRRLPWTEARLPKMRHNYPPIPLMDFPKLEVPRAAMRPMVGKSKFATCPLFRASGVPIGQDYCGEPYIRDCESPIRGTSTPPLRTTRELEPE